MAIENPSSGFLLIKFLWIKPYVFPIDLKLINGKFSCLTIWVIIFENVTFKMPALAHRALRLELRSHKIIAAMRS